MRYNELMSVSMIADLVNVVGAVQMFQSVGHECVFFGVFIGIL